MGTDIHLYVERFDGTQWLSCDQWAPDEYSDTPCRTVPFGKHYYDNRNYDLFAILADVRNGRGFAGIDTGDGFVPIAEARGLPNDLSPELKAETEAYLDHTPSWLLVAELMQYDWTRTTNKRGVVSAAQYAEWAAWRRGQGRGPEAYCGDVSGPRIRRIPESDMAMLVRDTEKIVRETDGVTSNGEVWKAIGKRLADTYTQVSWNVPYYRAADDFLSECLPRLWRLGDPDKVRIVFWFDS